MRDQIDGATNEGGARQVDRWKLPDMSEELLDIRKLPDKREALDR